MELRGKRIVLRPWQPDDAPNLARHANNPNIARFLRNLFPHPYTEQDAEAWITFCQNLPEGQIALAIVLDDEAIGAIGGNFKTDVHRRTFEIGYWLGETHWGKGIVSEALNLLCDYLFNETDCLRIEAHVFEGNTASARLLVKNGFDFEGCQRCAIEKNGELLDLLIHARVHPGISPRIGADPYDILSL